MVRRGNAASPSPGFSGHSPQRKRVNSSISSGWPGLGLSRPPGCRLICALAHAVQPGCRRRCVSSCSRLCTRPRRSRGSGGNVRLAGPMSLIQSDGQLNSGVFSLLIALGHAEAVPGAALSVHGRMPVVRILGLLVSKPSTYALTRPLSTAASRILCLRMPFRLLPLSQTTYARTAPADQVQVQFGQIQIQDQRNAA